MYIYTYNIYICISLIIFYHNWLQNMFDAKVDYMTRLSALFLGSSCFFLAVDYSYRSTPPLNDSPRSGVFTQKTWFQFTSITMPIMDSSWLGSWM